MMAELGIITEQAYDDRIGHIRIERRSGLQVMADLFNYDSGY